MPGFDDGRDDALADTRAAGGLRRRRRYVRSRRHGVRSRLRSTAAASAGRRRGSSSRGSFPALSRRAGSSARCCRRRRSPGRFAPAFVDAFFAERDVLVGRRVRRLPQAVAGLVAGPWSCTARSARGTTQTRPSTFASAVDVRSIIAASSPRLDAADDEARDVAQRGDRCCRCGNGRRSPSDSRDRRCARPSDCGTARWRRTAASRLRRGSGRRRCGDRPGTGSRACGSMPMFA